MRFKDEALQRLVETGDWSGVAHYYVPNLPDAHYLLWLVCFFILWLAWLRLMRWLRRPRIPWRLGNQTIDLRGGKSTIHSVLGGSSGNGKSSALLPLLKLDMPVAAVGFDDSAPLQEWWRAHEDDERYIHWQMDGTLGWNILAGPPLAVAEALTAGFERSTQDTGYYRGLARNRLVDLITEDDRAGRPRDLWHYVDMLRQGTNDSESNRACRRWAGSFETLLKTLGPALGTDFDLTSAMRDGKKVLLMPNRFMLAESAALIGGIGLVQARRAAAETGNFLVFIEEAGQARNYEQEIDAMFQAGRTRGCPTVLITQNMSKLREQVTNNVKAWVVFGQETRKEAEAAAEHVWNEPEDYLGLPVGTAWIRAPGVSTRRVKLPLVTPPKRRNSSVRLATPCVPTESSYQYERVVMAQPAPKEQEPETRPEWVQGEVRERVWSKLKYSEEPGLLWTPERGFWQDGPCLLWTGALRGDRPAAKIDGKTVTVYIETFKWAGNVIPESYECDHLCGTPQCCEPEHLEAVTTATNIARRDGRKRALVAAGEGRT